MNLAKRHSSQASNLTKVSRPRKLFPRSNQIYKSERETTRKKYVASLESRTPEQIAEEEALYIELKRLEQNERRFKREREELLRTLAGIESGLPEIIAVVDEEGPITSAMMHESASKRKRRGTLDTPSTPSNVISLAPPIPKRAQSAKSAAYGGPYIDFSAVT